MTVANARSIRRRVLIGVRRGPGHLSWLNKSSSQEVSALAVRFDNHRSAPLLSVAK